MTQKHREDEHRQLQVRSRLHHLDAHNDETRLRPLFRKARVEASANEALAKYVCRHGIQCRAHAHGCA